MGIIAFSKCTAGRAIMSVGETSPTLTATDWKVTNRRTDKTDSENRNRHGNDMQAEGVLHQRKEKRENSKHTMYEGGFRNNTEMVPVRDEPG